MFKVRETPEITAPVSELFSLKGKTCVVTGGSSGIGSSVVEAFASMGATVIIVYNSTPVDQVVKDLTKKYNVTIDSYKCNLLEMSEIEGLFDNVIKKYSKIDVLVANAGIGWLHGGVNEFESYEQLVNNWEKFMKVDLSSIYYCCSFIGKIFEKQGFGSLILTASMSGSIINVPQLQTPYNVAKAGVKQMARSLAVEWSAIGDGKIRVNSVSPGYVRTKLTGKMDPALVEKWCKLTPLGRMASPKEISGAYVYLASDASSYTTGCDLVVDGGYSLI
ncbi:hypothetical protein PICMEDRAFT_35923 [Pichia membranifaciens NRRL Y-2026]|uniref:Uncharacterized protein n=1 Tax=Pichia membranifaciens NRRL Y-2026 TaxID=763406 RepID=A0A1E3NFE9_9ASCO|nr:hypothetical protein PICMEDRAFT_35923 [Pichia membranifaciens NRRL Y-2026]ODQ44852.1 hypothetical protein PICMEDRAFT_35923 [Pichia membranifaciens NRRL Y-2026]